MAMECEIWVMVDAGGDYAAGCNEEEVTERYADLIGGDCARRLVRVVVTVPDFKVPTLKGTVPAEGEAGLTLSTEQ